jgi:hypothetical protein
MENDFRFYARDDMSLAEWLPEVATEEDAGAHRPASSASRAPAAAHAAMDFSSRMEPPQRPPADEDDVAQEVQDLVAMTIQAHRQDRDWLVWLGWNGRSDQQPPKKRQVWRSRGPQWGSQLLAISRPGARRLRERLNASAPEHIDMFLLKTIREDDELSAHSSYVDPPVGGFSSGHVSLNLKGKKRDPVWEEGFCQEGTNIYNAGAHRPARQRTLCKFLRHGWDEQISVELVIPPCSHEHLWRTCRPPVQVNSEDPHFQGLLQQLEWIGPSGEWVGPWFTQKVTWPEPAWKGGKGSREEQMAATPRDDRWRLLQTDPEGWAFGEGWEPHQRVSRVGFEVALSSGAVQGWAHGNRGARELRFLREQYKRRFFVTPEMPSVRLV